MKGTSIFNIDQFEAFACPNHYETNKYMHYLLRPKLGALSHKWWPITLVFLFY